MTAAWDVFQWAMFSLGCGSVLAVLLTAAWVALDGRSFRRERPQAPVAQPEPVIDDALPRLLKQVGRTPTAAEIERIVNGGEQRG
jgi:hypothetical protein